MLNLGQNAALEFRAEEVQSWSKASGTGVHTWLAIPTLIQLHFPHDEKVESRRHRKMVPSPNGTAINYNHLRGEMSKQKSTTVAQTV